MSAQFAPYKGPGSAVLAIDLGGRTIYCNGVAETMIGWPRQEIIGRSFDQIFRLDDGAPPQALGSLGTAGVGGGSVAAPASAVMVLHRNGFETPIDHTSAPIRARDGRIAGAMIIFRYFAGGQPEQRLDVA